MSNQFKYGDIIEPKPGDIERVDRFAGKSLSGRYEVTRADDVNVWVRPEGTLNMSVGLLSERFKTPSRRVEGAEIAPADIEVGDEILVTRTGHNITHMRQGIVGGIARQDHSGNGGLLLKTKGQYHGSGERLNWGLEFTETIVLVKAVPERDVLLDKLVGAVGGQVITYRGSLARKRNEERWEVLTEKGSSYSYSTDDTRVLISDSPVTWLKAGE